MISCTLYNTAENVVTCIKYNKFYYQINGPMKGKQSKTMIVGIHISKHYSKVSGSHVSQSLHIIYSILLKTK